MESKIKSFMALFISAILILICINPVNAEESDKKIKVMPLGDSITDGYSTVGGYRVPLCNLLQENQLSETVDFVGPNWGGDCYDPQHAGYSGYSIDNINASDSISGQRTGLSSFIDWLMNEYPADIVMLQIGTNDILSLYDLDNIDVRLNRFVDTVLSYIPSDGMLFLATIPCMDATNNLYISEYYFTSESMDKYINDYNDAIRKIVLTKQSEGKNVKLADINSVISKSDLYDGVHPSVDGYTKMGQYWYGILSNYINKSGEETDTTGDQYIVGDIDNDGQILLNDLIVLQKYILKINNLSENQYKAADITEDGTVDIYDVIKLRRILISTK